MPPIDYSRSTAAELDDLLVRYGILLQEVDRWFADCLLHHGEQIICRNGCAECCRGLFDITLLDALLLHQGIARLPLPIRERVVLRARDRLDILKKEHPWFVDPWLLNVAPEELWEGVMPEEDETPCILLSESGSCLVYAYRPMTCRLNGIPLIELDGEELFDEWCSNNFTTVDPRCLSDIRFGFRDLFAQELLLFRELSRRLLEEELNELDTLIPAAALLDIPAIPAAVFAAGLVRTRPPNS